MWPTSGPASNGIGIREERQDSRSEYAGQCVEQILSGAPEVSLREMGLYPSKNSCSGRGPFLVTRLLALQKESVPRTDLHIQIVNLGALLGYQCHYLLARTSATYMYRSEEHTSE